MALSCPMCGKPVAQVIKPAPDGKEGYPFQSFDGQVSTLACVGPKSCGWVLGLWMEVEAIEEIAELMRKEPVAA